MHLPQLYRNHPFMAAVATLTLIAFTLIAFGSALACFEEINYSSLSALRRSIAGLKDEPAFYVGPICAFMVALLLWFSGIFDSPKRRRRRGIVGHGPGSATGRFGPHGGRPPRLTDSSPPSRQVGIQHLGTQSAADWH